MTMNLNAFNELLNLLNEVYNLNDETLNEIKGYYDNIYNNLSVFSEFLQSELEWSDFELKNIENIEKSALVSILLRYYFESYYVDYSAVLDEFKQSNEGNSFDLYTKLHIGKSFAYDDRDLSENFDLVCKTMTELSGCTLLNTTLGEPNLIIIKQSNERRILELINELGVFQ